MQTRQKTLYGMSRAQTRTSSALEYTPRLLVRAVCTIGRRGRCANQQIIDTIAIDIACGADRGAGLGIRDHAIQSKARAAIEAGEL
jgi:hypothetical protein